jgi:hypothetical protein
VRWFDGTDGRTDDERAFLDALRHLAASSDWAIVPDDTWSVPLGVPLYLSIDIPAMSSFPGTRAAHQLEVALWPPDSHRGLRLDGFWGNSATPLDDFWPLEGGKLLVVGVEARAEDLAAWTMRWIERQLDRRLRLQRWKTGGAVVTTEDTSEHVGLRGAPWRRHLGAPSAELVVPAAQAHAFFTDPRDP